MRKFLLWATILLCVVGTSLALTGETASYEVDGYYGGFAQTATTTNENVSLGSGQLAIGMDNSTSYSVGRGVLYITEPAPINDTIPPNITSLNCSPDPATQGQTVQCNATITDDVALGGNVTNASVQQPQGNGFSDGHITNATTTDNSSTTATVSYGVTDNARGFFDFNISSIPDTAIIQAVHFNFTVDQKVGTINDLDFFALNETAAGQEGTAALYNKCGGSGTDKIYDDLTIPSTGLNSVAFNSNATSKVQNSLSSDIFSLCASLPLEGSSRFINVNTSESTTPPTLIVQYSTSVIQANVSMPNGTIEVQTVISAGSDVYYFNFTNTDNIGQHNVTWYAEDTSGNGANNQDNFTVQSVSDTTAPNVTGLTESPADPATYALGAVYTFNATVTDDVAVSTVILNFSGTNVTANHQGGGVYSANVSDLAAGVYSYNWWANDSSNNINSTENGTYTINKATSQCNLTAPSPVTYPNNVSATTSCNNAQQTVELFRNGTPVSNPYNETLAVGSYNISTRMNESQNYSAALVNWSVVTVQKGTPTLSLNLSPSDEVTYPTLTTVTGLGCPDELSCTLYVNLTLVANPHIATLGVGEHNYTFNVSTSQNYTAFSIDDILTILEDGDFEYEIIEIGEDFARFSWN